MNERKKIFLLVVIMAVSCISVTGTTIGVLYRTALREQKEVLSATAQSQARLIEAIAEFNATHLKNLSESTETTTLEQIIAAHKQYKGIGETGEITLAAREGGNIVFLLSHRYHDFNTPKPVPFNSNLAEPMRRALSGLSGIMIGLDYRGTTVLAAYEPVKSPGWGIVAKVDLAEIRTPFIKASILALLVAVLVILVGTTLFLSITNPILERLRQHSESLKEMVESLRTNEKMLQKAHSELEMRVAERTAELVQSNQVLESEAQERILAEQRLNALWKIAEMGDLEFRELCNQILLGSIEMTRSRFAFYGFLNEDESVMSVYSWSREVWERCRMQDRSIDLPIEQAGIWAEAVRKRETLIVNDYSKDLPEKRGLPEGHIALNRILVVPVFKQDRIVALAAVADKPEDYTETDAKQLASYAAGIQVIIEQRKTESELRESEKKYSALVESSLTGICVHQNSRIIFANPRFAEMHGYPLQDVLGMESLDFIHPDSRDYFNQIQERRTEGLTSPLSYEVKGIKKNGESLWTNRCNSAIEYQGAPAVLGNVIDITLRKEMEENLLKSETECRVLSRKVIETEENEKKRLARELHDGMGQSLAAIKYRAESFYLTAKHEAYGKAEELKSIVKMIQNAMKEMRKIHQDLRPAHIDELGIIKTIFYFSEEFQTTYPAFKVDTTIELTEPEVPEFVKASLFRIFQEAMNNAARHSGADRIRCRLRKNGDKIVLTVEDNGIGFDTKSSRRLPLNKKGLGLYSMRERAEFSGGKLEIRSTPGHGTTVLSTWPCDDI